MRLFHLTTTGSGGKHYAAKAGSLDGEQIISWVPRKGAAAMFSLRQAKDLRQRLRRTKIKSRLEPV